MIEIRGIAEYEAYSVGGGRSKRGGENQGAEFNELLQVGGERGNAGQASEVRKEAVIGGFGISGMEYAVYDHSGNRFLSGVHVGRNLDVEL